MKVNKILIWILALSNVALVAVLLTTRNSGVAPPPGHAIDLHEHHQGPHRPFDDPKMKSFMMDSIGFSESDFNKFKALRKQMDHGAKEHHETIKEAKTAIMSLGVGQEPDTVQMDSIMDIMCGEFRALDFLTMDHFHQLSKLGTAKNQEKLDHFLKEMIAKMGPPPRPKKK